MEEEAQYRQKISSCQVHFHSLAAQNARKDADIFKVLFADVPFDSSNKNELVMRESTIKHCLKIVFSNIEDVLNTTVSLFSFMNGVPCAACVWMFDAAEVGLPVDQSFVRLISRDNESYSSRDHLERRHPIKGNTIFSRIFSDGNDLVFENNLSDKARSGDIKLTNTVSSEVGKYYNSIFIVPIPGIGDNAFKPRAALCVDTLQQFSEFQRESCHNYARELAWRLAVMLYRVGVLGGESEVNVRNLERGRKNDR